MRNCVLFVAESLRFDVLSRYRDSGSISDKDLTDRLNAESIESLEENGEVIPNLHSTHTSSPPASASLLTGLYPREHGLYASNRLLNDDVKTLPEYFSDAGWHTLIMNGHSTFPKNGIASRFDEFRQGPVRSLISLLKDHNSQGRKVFAYVHTLDTSVPYLLSKYPSSKQYHATAVEEANELSNKLGIDNNFRLSDSHGFTNQWHIPWAGEKDLPVWQFMVKSIYENFNRRDTLFEDFDQYIFEQYIRGVNIFINRQLFSLANYMNESDHAENTTLFFTADHGDSPVFSHGYPVLGESVMPREDIIRVPGIAMNYENVDLSSLDDHIPRSLVDIAPTVLKEHEIDVDPEQFSGELLTVTDDRTVYADSTITLTDPRSLRKETTDHSPDMPVPAILDWYCGLDSNGYKLYRRGEELPDDLLQLPLDSFVRIVFERMMFQPMSEEDLQKRVDKLAQNDSVETRQQFLDLIEEDAEDWSPELYHWLDDPLEQNELLKTKDEKYDSIADELTDRITHRFESIDSCRSEVEEIDVVEPREDIKFQEPLEGVGYVE